MAKVKKMFLSVLTYHSISVNNVRDYAWQSDFDIYVKPRFVSRFSAPFNISLKHNLLFARQYLKVFKCRVLAFDL